MREQYIAISSEDGKRKPKRLNFTVGALNAIRPPASGRIAVYDTKVPALAFMVTDKGGRAFYFYRSYRGKPLRMHLGDWPAISIEQARNLAAEKNGLVAKGIDPRIERKQGQAEKTLGELWDHYYNEYALPYKRSARDDNQRYRDYLKKWQHRLASSITSADVESLKLTIGKTKPGTATHVISLLSSIYQKSGMASPTVGVKGFALGSRKRRLSPDEIHAFHKALAEENQQWQDFFGLLFLTGARRSNVIKMEWAELDLANATWVIPGGKHKTKKDSDPMYLVPEAVAILKRRQAEQADAPSTYVFSGPGRKGHIVQVWKALERIQKRMGVDDFNIHDIRRTVGSTMADSNVSETIIAKALSHTSTSATKNYTRVAAAPVRKAMEEATQTILAAAQGKAKPEPTSHGTKSRTETHSIADDLAKLAALRTGGLLTDEEFAAAKAKLLAK